MNRLKLTLAALALAPLAAFAAPEELLAVCQSCHGPGGAKPIAPEYAILAGQYANYLERAMLDYRSGARKNPVMNAQAASLSDEDIAALARYFSEQEGPLRTPRPTDGSQQ